MSIIFLSPVKQSIARLCLVILAGFYLSACIEGSIFDVRDYSAIFVTNNTHETLFVTVNTAEEQKFWQQHVESIEPLQTKRILTLDRRNDQDEGEQQNFSTYLSTVQGDGFQLLQTLTATKRSDDMKFGIEANDVSSGWKDKNDHYSYTSNFDSQAQSPTRIAFESKSKTFFKDVYYSVTSGPNLVEMHAEPETLSIATYNVWALTVISKDISTRLGIIPAYFKQYDVLMLQEVFDASRTSFLQALAADYPYQTTVLNTGSSKLHDGGVVIVSRFPIVNEAEFTFPDCSGTDCFAAKGVKYAEIVKAGNSYHIFSTHAASFDTDTARENRRKQFVQIRDFAESLAISVNERVIYGGDLNVNKLKFPGDYAQMLAYLQADEPAYTGYTKATFDPDINEHATATGSGSKHPEYLDYILMSNEYGAYQSNQNEVFIPRHDHEKLWGIWDLSDHFPVRALIH